MRINKEVATMARSGVLLSLVLVWGCAERRPTSVELAVEVVGEHLRTPVPRLTDESVLRDFSFVFVDGDHGIGSVRLLAASDGSVRALFADGGLEDPWGLYARWSAAAKIPTLERAVECTTGEGFCDIDLRVDVTDRYRFALVGFEFERIGGGDLRIRSIGISPGDPEPRLLRVTFKDDSPEDDRFRCRVQYKLLPFNPRSRLPASWSFSGGNNRRSAERLEGAPEDRVLSGFQFNYIPNNAEVLQLGTSLNDGSVLFRDNDLEEQISWKVDYLRLESWSPDNPEDVSDEEAELGPPGRVPDPSEVESCLPHSAIYLQCNYISLDGTLVEVNVYIHTVRLTGSFGVEVLRQHCASESVWVTVHCTPPPPFYTKVEHSLTPDGFCSYGESWSRPRHGLTCKRID